MEKTITILYTAQTPEPFSTLAEYAIKSGAIVTINPEKRTVLAEAPTSK